MTAGYSGTPLAKKLSLKDGMRVWWDGVPASVREEIGAERLKLGLLSEPEAPIDAAHIFVIERAELEAKLKQLLPLLSPAGFIWVSWPKKAAKVPTKSRPRRKPSRRPSPWEVRLRGSRPQ